jgi:hypothetical protein
VIPDLAVIVAIYAVVRLLNEYVFEGDKLQPLRFGLALIAAAAIAFFTADVVSLANSSPSI